MRRADLWLYALCAADADDWLFVHPAGPPGRATGAAFGLASMVSPVLLLTVITGVLSRKMRREIPGYVKWFRLGSYLLLMGMPFVISI